MLRSISLTSKHNLERDAGLPKHSILTRPVSDGGARDSPESKPLVEVDGGGEMFLFSTLNLIDEEPHSHYRDGNQYIYQIGRCSEMEISCFQTTIPAQTLR